MIVRPHQFPIPASANFRITVNGFPVEAYPGPGADFASFECDGPVQVAIGVSGSLEKAQVRPLSRGIVSRVQDAALHFDIPGPCYWQIEIPGQPLLYLYAMPPATEPPAGREVLRFGTGKIHEIGEIRLRDDQVLWLDPGAVVRGHVFAQGAKNVLVGGYGLLQAWYAKDVEHIRFFLFDTCENVRVENVLLTTTSGWMIQLAGCQGAEVSNVREISTEGGTDGADIVGSRNVRISGCCFHNGDDNIAIKAFPNADRFIEAPAHLPRSRWGQAVENVLVSDCIFHNTHGGSSMEIGYETSTDRISNIRFENIDVLAVHQFGSVFGIHNGDRAVVEDVVWENIRVEHHYDKLIDFRVLNSRWNVDVERGYIRDISLRNIEVVQSIYNSGYTLSVICGFDAAHPVDGVKIDNFRLSGRPAANADHLDLVGRHAHNIQFI